MKQSKQPVVFAMFGKGKKTVKDFKAWIKMYGGSANNVLGVVCDMFWQR
jgi:hypothetical protein